MYGVVLSDDDIRKRLTRLRNLERLHIKDRATKADLRNRVGDLERQNHEKDDRIIALEQQVRDLQRQLGKLTDNQTKYRFYLFGENKNQRPPLAQAAVIRSAESYVRPSPRPEEITARQQLALKTCPRCHGHVSDTVETFTTYVEDVTFRPKSVTEYTVHRHWCGTCSRLVRAPIPNALPGMSLGLNTVLFVLVEHYRAKKTDEQIVESLRTYFHLTVSSGEVSVIRHTAGRYFGNRYTDIVKAIRLAHVIYVDETGWFVQGVHGQCWHVSAPEVPAVLYKLANSRAKDELQSLIGTGFEGIVVSDFYSVYDGAGHDQQKCWVHLLRDAHLLRAARPRSRQRKHLHDQLLDIYGRIHRFREQAWEQSAAAELEASLDEQLVRLARRAWSDDGCRRLAKRLNKYHRELLACIRYPTVLPENNTAERGLHPVVVQRKITYGNRSRKGARTYEVNKSVIETFRAEGGDLAAKLHDLLWQQAWAQKFGVTSLA